jgi:virginiamycin A acetyltransferase
MIGQLLYWLYRFHRRRLRALILWIVLKMEGGPLYSVTLRRIFKDYHQVEVGMYTHGSCFTPGNFDRFTTVGRYCSIAADVRTFNRDHPLDFKSTHAFFFNPALRRAPKDLVGYNPLRIGNDVWIGYGVIILPGVREIGDGVVIGAGSVVSKNIPPYAIAVGHPIRIVRYRFSPEVIRHLLKEKWWEKSIEEIQKNFEEYTCPFENYLSARRMTNSGYASSGVLGQDGEP